MPVESLPLVPLEVKVQKQARRFTLPALLDVLYSLNYRSDDIEFRGHLSQARPSSLIHAVDFFGNNGRRRVKVTVNLGLLSVQSPLPSYLLKFAESLESDALIEFLGFFDHHLIKRRTMGQYPERDRTVFADWGQAQTELLEMTGLGAPSTLHWMCERIYPELGVRVERSTAQKPLRAQGAILGHAVLGEGCAFGAGTSVPVGGIDIMLYAEETHSPTNVPWPKEAALRLHQRLFSVIGGSELYLRVYLVMMEQEGWLEMTDGRFLGYEPLWDPSRPTPPALLPKALRDVSQSDPNAKLLRREPVPPPAGPGLGKLAAKKPSAVEKAPAHIHLPPLPPPPSPPSPGAAPPPPRYVPLSPDERESRTKRRIYQVQLFAGPLKHAKSAPQTDPAYVNIDEYLVVSDT